MLTVTGVVDHTFYSVNNEDCGQTGKMLRLIPAFVKNNSSINCYFFLYRLIY